MCGGKYSGCDGYREYTSVQGCLSCAWRSDISDGPSDLQIQTLVERVEDGGVREVILALSPTMEGDTTNFYIYRKLENAAARISVIARGVAQNDELQYTDEVTLGRSIVNRVVFTGQM